MVSKNPAQRVAPTGAVYFPLAANAHALVTGTSLAGVRARMKTASILYDQVLIEAGKLEIQAGPTGARRMRLGPRSDGLHRWQTAKRRGIQQKSGFSVSAAIEKQYGVPAPGPYHTVVQSLASISWAPTFEPFLPEVDRFPWITFGAAQPGREHDKLVDRWKRLDDQIPGLEALFPDRFVRSQITDNLAQDLAMGTGGGWDISVDRLHARIIGMRLSSAPELETRSVALPILVPRVGDLGWEDIAKIRKLRGVTELRELLREVEHEAFEKAKSDGDVEELLRSVYMTKLVKAAKGIHGIRSISATAVTELVIGSGTGYAMSGITGLTPLEAAIGGGAATATIITGIHVREQRRQRRARAWIGVMDAIAAASQQTGTS